MDKDIEKLISKAEGKKWWNKFFPRSKQHKKAARPERPAPTNAERYEVFMTTTYNSTFRFLSKFFYVASLALILIVLLSKETHDGSEAYIFLLFFMPLPAYLLVNLLRYIHFLGWRKRLPFRLEGWEDLANTNDLDRISWRNNCTISIIIRDPDPLQTDAINAALAIFTREAEKQIYTADMKDKNRIRIKPFSYGSLKAAGSANVDIIRLIRKLCEGDLSMLARKFENFEAVKLGISRETYSVLEHDTDFVAD
ncbi:MAG: hypothetical protein MUD12_12675 [Spirochaetes bacterium]|jgi:hypothetical protein|nr:hypothetical protein [Spirochaetota bacterium]